MIILSVLIFIICASLTSDFCVSILPRRAEKRKNRAIGEVQDSRWLRETKEECAGKDVFLLEIAKGRALDGSAPFDSEGG